MELAKAAEVWRLELEGKQILEGDVLLRVGLVRVEKTSEGLIGPYGEWIERLH